MNRKIAFVLCAAATAAVSISAPVMAQSESEEGVKAEHRPKLWVGDHAPTLEVSDWVKGEPVEGFEKGHVYVVEFWATWCGPCIASMPHLSEIQKRLGDKGATVIGVSSRDGRNSLEAVKKMVKEKGDTMGYTVAYDADRSVYASWMQAAEQRGIPASFVIDKAGKIAYIGHPMWLDFPLEGILNGTWEPEAGMKKVEDGQKLLTKTYQGGSAAERFEAWKQFETEYPMVARQSMFAPMKFNLLLETGQYAKAWETGEHLVVGAIKKDDEQMLNDIAWTIVDPESGLDEPNLPLALKAAHAANKITGEGDAAILDTLARVYWLMGEKSHAIELQRKAVEHAEGAMKEGVSGTLKEYEEAIKTGG